MDSSSDIVELNVGGRIFTTTKSTLVASSYFEVMFSGKMQPGARDKEGRIFIDRSPEKFYWVLEWLRCGPQELPDGVSQKDIKNELAYFAVEFGKEKAISQEPSKKRKRETSSVFKREPAYQKLVSAILQWKESLTETSRRCKRWTLTRAPSEDNKYEVMVDRLSFEALYRLVIRSKPGSRSTIPTGVKQLATSLCEDTGIVSVKLEYLEYDSFAVVGQMPK